MSGGDAMELSGLIERLMSNPIGVVEIVLTHALAQLGQDEDLVGIEARPPEELIGVALGSRLVQMINNDETSTKTSRSAAHSSLQDYEELVDRNGSLAAALGACDCWGQRGHCPICDGAGGPGWLPPDRRLFAIYVRPAIRALTHPDEPPTGRWRPTANSRKEEASKADVESAMRSPKSMEVSPNDAGRATENHRKETEGAYPLAR